MSPKTKRIARAVIAVVVIAGLILATRRAFSQWQTQQRAAEAEIDDLRDRIRSATPTESATLQAELETARRNVPRLSNLNWKLVGLAGGLYLVSLVPGGLVLHEATRMMGFRVSRHAAVAAQVVGHLGKYVPGKAMVVVIRAGRLSGHGVPIFAGSVAVVLETFLMMAVGSAVAGCLIFLLPAPRWIAWSALIGGVTATLPTLPPILSRVAKRLGKKTMANRTPAETEWGGDRGLGALDHDWRFFINAWIWQLASWALIGLSFVCLVCSLPGVSDEYSTLVIGAACIASITLAMVVGFVSLLPGGAGIRELTLTVVLAPVTGASQALMAAILARMVFIAAELLGVAIVHAFGGQPEGLIESEGPQTG